MLLPCLICKTKRTLFKISTVYGRTDRPIRDYIIHILGPCGEHLHDDCGLCRLCLCFLNILLYIKERIFSLISLGKEDNCDKPFINFSHVYKNFTDNLLKLNYDEYENEVDQNISELIPGHSSPFEEECETNDYNRIGTPYADREVENTLSGRRRRGRDKGWRKRRGHNWSRLKNFRPQSGQSHHSEPVPRTNQTSLSTTNFSEYQVSDSDDYNREVRTSVESVNVYQNGILPSICSRPIDKMQNQQTTQSKKKFKCITNCLFEFDCLDNLTNHKRDDHGLLAKYVCYECYATKMFVSSEDLKLHDDMIHSRVLSNCFKCSLELRTKIDLQKHLRKPHLYSCNYCDLSFITQEDYEEHVNKYHKGKKKVIKRFVKNVIVNRSYGTEDLPSDILKSNDTYNGQVIWRLQNSLKDSDAGTRISTNEKNLVNENSLYIQDEVNINKIRNEDVTIISNSVENSSHVYETSEAVSNTFTEINVGTTTKRKLLDEIVTYNEGNKPTDNFM